MVKTNLFFVVLLLISSCGDKVTTLRNGKTVVPSDMSIFKNRIFFDKQLLTKVDTSAIYKEEYGYLSVNEDGFEPLDGRRSHRDDKYVGFYKFHSDGFVTSFIEPEDNIKLDESNNGYKGVFYKKNDKVYMDLYIIIRYSFTPRYGLDKRMLLIKGDTILFKSLNNPRSIKVYIKGRSN